jgi:hypothetical protein
MEGGVISRMGKEQEEIEVAPWPEREPHEVPEPGETPEPIREPKKEPIPE